MYNYLLFTPFISMHMNLLIVHNTLYINSLFTPRLKAHMLYYSFMVRIIGCT